MFDVKKATKVVNNMLGEVDKNLDQLNAEMDKMFDNDFVKTIKDSVDTILSYAGPFPSFPPINVFTFRQTTNAEKNKDGPLNEYVVELALSGYKSENVDVTVETVNGVNFLVIESKGINERVGSDVKWYQRGIAGRAFKVQFMIANNLKVTKAVLEHGLLSINLSVEPTKTSKVQKIDLTSK